jgi:Zn finger protein HypA/HybF involved in hydrogenase expression
MTRKKHDWSEYGDEIIELYRSGLSVRDLIPVIAEKYGKTYASGTLTNFIGSRGALRSKVDARRLAISKARRLCELCGKTHAPRNWNQRWCDACTGFNKHKKRVRNHGLPATLFEKMFEEQNHKCKICDREFETCLNTREKKTLFVDHDHVTNQVRGLLCPRCNSGMSYIDNESWLARALQYIEDVRSQDEKICIKPPRMRRYVRNNPVDITTQE